MIILNITNYDFFFGPATDNEFYWMNVGYKTQNLTTH